MLHRLFSGALTGVDYRVVVEGVVARLSRLMCRVHVGSRDWKLPYRMSGGLALPSVLNWLRVHYILELPSLTGRCLIQDALVRENVIDICVGRSVRLRPLMAVSDVLCLVVWRLVEEFGRCVVDLLTHQRGLELELFVF